MIVSASYQDVAVGRDDWHVLKNDLVRLDDLTPPLQDFGPVYGSSATESKQR